ncbi:MULTISPECIES: large conductance mechanosensitive channel protein MscL [unclassified Streptococcus]|uniref:large conductance mechanosensitive channel protein MscL n=1 Tax=unclassified Streptococcus TaxID=2608887 RepID=UPI0011B76613|nr:MULTISPECIES: large conductance mechanosensitive channel protein MscL [unclassified Streptococcus]TWS95472.1 large conductance mechanosensitive channel protein MscL [Streptococcus sp. sy018]TWT16596.1 large conductance mechanosensitive channel protein MscL [Streptococcus sp. sy010]
MLKELKDFLFKGNIVDLAVAVIIGAAFSAIVTSLVADIITPIIGMIIGQPDFSGIMLGSIAIGKFINAVVNFLIVGTVMFFIVKAANKAMKAPAEEAPAGPSQEELLAEIRDLLAKK